MQKKIHVLIVLFLLGSFSFCNAQSFFSKFKDSVDGAFDVSYFLKDLHGVLPIISPITEPAVGYGFVGALLYFITKKPKDGTVKIPIPDIPGAGGGYTQNGTWFAGLGYLGFWKDDKIRYRGIVGYGDINLKYYRSLNFFPEEISAEFGIKSTFILHQVKFRLGQHG